MTAIAPPMPNSVPRRTRPRASPGAPDQSTLRQTAGADPTAPLFTGHPPSTCHVWTILLTRSPLPVANALGLGTVLSRSGPFPRNAAA